MMLIRNSSDSIVLPNGQTVPALDQYEWSCLIVVLVLVAIGSYLFLRWCKRTVQDVARDLQGSIDLDHELDSIPQPNDIDVGHIKQEIKDLLKQAKADLAQAKQERSEALQDSVVQAGRRGKKTADIRRDYSVFYDLKAKDFRAKMDTVRTLLNTIPESNADYHVKVSALVQQMEEVLHSLRPNRIRSER